jgi:type IV pilus assembly protein PilW
MNTLFFASAPARFRCPASQQRGVTLVELMISITLGLIVVMAATALLLSSKTGYAAQDDESRTNDTGRYAIESVARAVRQAAYVNWDRSEAPFVVTPGMSANIAGLDARRVHKDTYGIDSPVTDAVNGSDVLAVRYFGAGSGQGDGTMTNCAGFSVAAPANTDTADESRGWSIFYVANGSSGEPQLYCKYRGDKDWATDAIARGVESFQVLYGVDTDGDGMPNRLISATEVDALDAMSIPQGAGAAEKNAHTHWKKIVTVKIALLVRGESNVRSGGEAQVYDLFGKDYSDAHAGADKGVHFSEGDFSKAVRNRSRHIYSMTIQLRNQPSGSGA